MQRSNAQRPDVRMGPRIYNRSRSPPPSGSNSQLSYTEDEDLDGPGHPADSQHRRQYTQSAGEINRHNEEINRRRPLGVEQHVVRFNDRSPPFLRQTQESRNHHAAPKPVEEQRYRPSVNPRYADTESAGVSRQQPTSYTRRDRSSGHTHLHSPNPPIDQPYHPTYYDHQDQMLGSGHNQWSHMHPGGTASQYQTWPFPQQPNSPSPNLPPHYWPIQDSPFQSPPPPPPPHEDEPLANGPPPSPSNRELLVLKEELRAMRELADRAEIRKQMEEQIRKDVEHEFQNQMKRAKEAQERAREEIEKIRSETEIETRKKILAERHAQAERERLEAQQAIRLEREVRLKVERERVAEEKAEKDRMRQREEIEILMREKMLQSMEELTSMARGKLMIGFEEENEPSNKITDVETKDETVLKGTKVNKGGEEMFSNSGANECQENDAGIKEQEVSRKSSDVGDMSEQQISTPRLESQKPHDQYRFRYSEEDDTTEDQDFSTREGSESRASTEHPSNASIDSDATHFSFKMSGARENSAPPPAPDIPGMSEQDDWMSSSSRGSRPSSYRPKKSRRAHSTYGQYPMDEGQHLHQEYQSYQEYHPYQDYYPERYPYQQYHQDYHRYPENQHYQGYRPEVYSYPASSPNPAQMGDLVEQVIDGVLSRLRVVPIPRWNLQKTQPPPHEESFPRVATVSSGSTSDVESAHSEAATLQNQLCELTRETSINGGSVLDARLTTEGGVLLMKSNLLDGLETPKPQTQMHIDVTAATATAACHDEDVFYTPTESSDPTMQAYFE